MPVLGDADKIMVGTGVADKVYMGATEVWSGDTTPPGPAPDFEWDFEGGTLAGTLNESGMTNVGVPVYGTGLVGALGVDLVGSANGIGVPTIPPTDHTGSLYVKVNAQHTSSALRTILIKDDLNGWLSGIRHHNGGDLHVLNGSSAVEVLGDWRPYLGDVTRIDWQYTQSTGTFVWKFFADGGDTAPLWTSADIVNTSLNAGVMTIGANGGPGTGNFTVDNLRLWDDVAAWPQPIA